MHKTELELEREETVQLLKSHWGDKALNALDAQQMSAIVTFMDGLERPLLCYLAAGREIKVNNKDESAIIDGLISHAIQEGQTISEFLDDIMISLDELDDDDLEDLDEADEEDDDLPKKTSAYILAEEMNLSAVGPSGVIGVKTFPYGSIFFEPSPKMDIAALTLEFTSLVDFDGIERVIGYSHETQRCYALPRQSVVQITEDDGMKLLEKKAEQDKYNSTDYNACQTIVFQCQDERQMRNLAGVIERMIELMPGVEIVEQEDGDLITLLETVRAVAQHGRTVLLDGVYKSEIIKDLVSNVTPHIHSIKEHMQEQYSCILGSTGQIIPGFNEDEESE